MQNTTINLQTQSVSALDGCKTYSSSSITIITYYEILQETMEQGLRMSG